MNRIITNTVDPNHKKLSRSSYRIGTINGMSEMKLNYSSSPSVKKANSLPNVRNDDNLLHPPEREQNHLRRPGACTFRLWPRIPTKAPA